MSSIYDFLVDTYATERLKTLSVWSMWSVFADDDLAIRPHHTDERGRNACEQMIHQCMSENLWFCKMLDIDVEAPPLPREETRVAFIEPYAEDSGKRLAALREKPEAWGAGQVGFFEVERSRAYDNQDALIEREAAGGAKTSLPGAGGRAVTERPGSKES